MVSEYCNTHINGTYLWHKSLSLSYHFSPYSNHMHTLFVSSLIVLPYCDNASACTPYLAEGGSKSSKGEHQVHFRSCSETDTGCQCSVSSENNAVSTVTNEHQSKSNCNYKLVRKVWWSEKHTVNAPLPSLSLAPPWVPTPHQATYSPSQKGHGTMVYPL